jgi:hypothetical protein
VAHNKQRCGATYRKKQAVEKANSAGAKNRRDRLKSKTTINHRSAGATPDRRTYQGLLF